MSQRQDPNLLLETSFGEGVLLVVAAAASMLFGLFLAVGGYFVGWVIGLFPSVFLLRLLVRRLSRYSTLLLTPGGFTYESRYECYSFRWSDVDQFLVAGTGMNKVIAFTLAPAARNRSGENILPEHYGMGTSELCLLLNEWRMKHREKFSRSRIA